MFGRKWQTNCMMCMRMSGSRALKVARQVESQSMCGSSGSPERT